MKAHNLIYTLVLGLQALFVSIPTVGSAGDLISVIVADTKDHSIGGSTTADLNKMQLMMSKIAANTNMKLRQVTLSDKNTVPKKMLDSINTLTVNEDDVVIFYFSGHGYRTPSKGDSLWPNLYFSIRDEGVEYEKVVSILQKKNPRLLITMADVCNSMISDSNAPLLIRGLMIRGEIEKRFSDNYRRLFLETNGLIRVTSSKAGEYSWATSSGGTFTLAFIKSFNEEVSSSVPAEWSNLLDRVSYEVRDDDQHPVYVIETTQNI